MRGTAATLGCAVVLGGATYAALSAARLVAVEAGEPCGPASATSPPLLGVTSRARMLYFEQCLAVVTSRAHVDYVFMWDFH